MIEVKNLHKSFGELKVLQGVDLTIQQGEVVAVIGPSGTGKSTLLRCINYLERPDEGVITIGDVTVDAKTATKKEIHRLRGASAMVFQNYNLFRNMTVLANVMEPLTAVQKKPKQEAEKEAMEYLTRVGLAESGMNTPPTFRAASSSGWALPGQWQSTRRSCCSMNPPLP